MTSGAEEVDPEGVVLFFGKVYDLNPRRAILVAMPRLSKDAQRLSALYKVEVISGTSIEELVGNFESLLAKGVVAAPKPEIVKEDWFDAVDLRSLREKTSTLMERRERALNE
jgi:hypothetical protein